MIEIMLVDDHVIMREGIKSVLDRVDGFQVINEASDGREAYKLCQKHLPDLIVMDLSMKGLNGIQATELLLKDFPELKIICFSMHSEQRYVHGMLNAGAKGYLLKDVDSDEFIKAIRGVMKGKVYVCHKIAKIVLNEIIYVMNDDLKSLSLREKEILQLISEGKSSRNIAEELFLSSKTVDVHRKNIMDKLEIYSLPELTKYAILAGITTLDEL